MRKIMFIPVILGVSVLAFGCGGGGGSGDQTATEGVDAAPATDMAEESQESNLQAAAGRDVGASYDSPGRSPAATPAMLEIASVEVNGQLGCGHCSFGVKDECSLALKTEDGEVYLIEAGDRQEELMDKRLDEPSVKVAGQVGEIDGQKVIYTESVELY